MRRCLALCLALASCHDGDGGGGGGASLPASLPLVAFRAEAGLFSVDLAGGNLRRHAEDLVIDYAWSPAGRLAWRTSAALFVDGVAVSRGPVEAYAWSTDDRIAFLAGGVLFVDGAEIPGVLEFSWGGARIAWRTEGNELFVDGARVAGGALEFAWSPLGDFLAFRGPELFTVRLDRGEVIRISLGVATSFAWAPDGSRVAWLDGAELFTSPPHQQFVARIFDRVVSYGWSPDSQRLALISDSALDGRFELYSGFRGGGIPVKLSTNGGVTRFAWSPDSTRLLFLATDGLFVVPATSSLWTRLAGGGVSAFAWAPDGTLVAYVENGALFASGRFVAPDVTRFAWSRDLRLVHISGGTLLADGTRLADDGVLDFLIR